MKTRTKLIGLGVATILVAGLGLYPLTASSDDGQHGFRPPFMRGAMGPGMMQGMGMGAGAGPAMMGGGHDAATMAQLGDIHALLTDHDHITRTVTNLPDGIRTVTESGDPEVAARIKKHVATMGDRVQAGDDPGLPIESPALHGIFADKDKIHTTYETTEKGVVVVQTSDDAATVAELQKHAAEVTDLVKGGMAALQAAMMRNHGGMMPAAMMGRMMHGPMMHSGPGVETAPSGR